MTIAELRRQLTPGATYYATWIGPIAGNRPRTTRRRVVSQSGHVMQSEIIDDSPQSGHVMRLEWGGVRASEWGGVVTLADESADFIKIDTIEGPNNE